ncbi:MULTISPECIES: TonB-dependent receptor [Sphingobium]|jgi:iron complex outermembrane receptor protein|uniref:TonB-dependent receptor n=1 Tax=Sphingobium TaxID=165695 RepID=UPI000DBAF571|nr:MULTISPECIES: TonB-dependent receptor [Sphingobium]KAA9017768.1 TonB-dependent receptor [Sphingobium limneticum]MBU0932387.1 TonB-dependent receptor [Alphaproteobacteria bacterium]BBD00116.1 iron complex outermembrane recepter protein [Sphingobium sp. YG1]
MRFITTKALAILLCSGVSQVALAQEAASAPQPTADNGDIIVTAQRRSQSMLSVPLAISALGGETLQNKGISNSAALATAVPNLQVSSPYGSTQPNFSLRGISVANEYNSNQASPVGVYIDDVYIAARTSHGMGLFDLDRVEVLRGPQGTLFGRNTTGGAINFITRAPKLSGTNSYAEVGYGNFNTSKAQAAIETTMVEDELGIRVAGNYEKGDGMLHNVAPGGRDSNSVDTAQGRVYLRMKPGNGPLDIKIRAYAGRDRGAQAAIHGLTGPNTPGQGFFDINENDVGENRTDAWGVAANVALELSPTVTLTSITSYDGGKQNLQQAADGSPLNVLNINWRSNFRQFSEEARLNYEGERLKLVGGGFYGWDRTITDNRFNIGSALAPGVDGGFFQHYRQTRRSYAAFLQGDYGLTDKLVLTLGARYTWDKAKYGDAYAYLFAGPFGSAGTPLASTVPCAGVAGTCAYDPAARYAIDGSNKALTGRAALSYTFDGGTLVYASYSRGYRSGAFNGGGYTSSVGITYIDPERVNAYEVGVKGRFLDNKLTLSAAGFYYDYSNQQVQDTRPGPVSFLVNAPKSQVYGGEVEASLRPIDGLVINLSGGYLHATYKDLTLQNTDLSGNDLPFAPRWTGTAGFDWTIFDTGSDSLTFSPTVNYFSRQYFSPFNGTDAVGTAQNNAELQQKGYAKVNATLAWAHGPFQLRGWINNAFNRKTYSYGLDLRGAGFPYNFLVPAMPRTFGVTGRFSF